MGFRDEIRKAKTMDEMQNLCGKVNKVVDNIPTKTRRRILIATEKRTKELMLSKEKAKKEQSK